jgi:hypothetical protein
VIKGNFKIKKIELDDKDLEDREFEQLIQRSGAGSHMVFRSKNENDEFFVDEI